MKLVLIAALVLVVCYFATIEHVDAQAVTTTVPPPPKNKTCGRGRGRPRGGKSRGPGGNPANRTTRSVEDVMSSIEAASKSIADAAKQTIKTAGVIVKKGANKAKTFVEIKGNKIRGSTTTTAAPA